MASYLTLLEQLSTAVDQLNQVLQGDETTTVDINGKIQPSVQKKTLDEVNAKVKLVLDAAADIDAVKYATTAAGIAATTDGQFFSVVSNDDNIYLDLYKNDDGVAVFKKTYPSSAALLKISTLKNIAKNQNFFDSSNITATNSDIISVESNVLTFRTTIPYGQVYQNVGINANDKYYISAQLKSSSPASYLDVYRNDNGVQIGVRNHSGTNEFEKLDFIFESASSASSVRLRVLDPRSGYECQVKEMMLINLTQTFGEGKEPAIEAIRDIINTTTNGNDFFEDDNALSFSNIVTPSDNKKNFFVKLAKNRLVVIQKYNQTHDLKLVWESFYPNYLFNLKSINLIANTRENISSDYNSGDEIIGLGTDTLGPWLVKAINNIDGDMPSSKNFTGGSHGYNNNYNQSPSNTKTAELNTIYFKIDGLVRESFSGYCDQIDVFFENSVQAANTKKADGSGRHVLKEKYHLNFCRQNINVNCSVEFAEMVTVEKYYGLQSVIPAIFKDKIFYHTCENMKIESAGELTDSISGHCNQISIWKGVNHIDMSLDTSVGLGRLHKRTTTNYSAFTTSYNKSYFYLIENHDFNEGDIVTYSGKYSIHSRG